MSESTSNSGLELTGPSRVEAFSDGVLAIVITLLVLEIKVPHFEAAPTLSESLAALLKLAPKFQSYLLSFLFIAVFWVNHHRFFRLVERMNTGLLWLNNLLLLTLSFTPFPTAWIGEYPNDPIGLGLFSFMLMSAGIAFNVMWRYTARASLFKDAVDEKTVQAAFKIGLVGPILYLAAGIFAFLLPLVTWILLFIVPLFYAFPSRRK